MINQYKEILSYDGDEWQDFMNKICLFDIFKDLIAKYGNGTGILRSFIKYIVWTYSRDSEMVIIGSDWGKNKKRIFDAAGFQPIEILLNATVYLEDDTVLKTIQRWLEFQDDNVYTQMCVLKDLMVEMQVSANSSIKKSSGEIDYDQKYKNACYVKELRKMINDLESELIQNSPKLKEAASEIRTANKRIIISPEKFAV